MVEGAQNLQDTWGDYVGRPDEAALRMIVARLRQGTPARLPEDACWPWQGSSVSDRGYGQVNYTVDRQRVCITAPRAVLALKGLVPFRGRKHHACHTCDNPICVNERHLFPGNAKKNHDDMVAKGRADWQQEREPGARLRTFARRVRKLTDEDVRAIRADRRGLRKIALDYDVAVSTISRVRHGGRKGTVDDGAGVKPRDRRRRAKSGGTEPVSALA